MNARDELAEALGGGQIYYEPQRTLHYMKADSLIAEGWRKMPSREEIADEISGVVVGSGYYSTQIGREAALEAADAILALMDGGSA